MQSGFIAPELEKRFEVLRSENNLKNLKADPFANRAAEHLSELNAIHPFREGNGRVLRAFLVVLGRQAGHRIEIQRIDPKQWNEASRQSFLTVNPESMRSVVKGAIAPIARQQDREQSHDHDRGGRGR